MNDVKRNEPTAAVIIIGEEILSGRTQDTNLAAIARFLAAKGIAIREARVVADDEAAIIEAVNALRARNTYVFTTGGIGPTHDDITAACVAKAFGRPFGINEEARALLAAHYAPGEFNEARMRMAMTPEGAVLIENAVSIAPGFQVENVFVMAGVPKIMRAMLESLGDRLEPGAVFHAESIHVSLPEGAVAKGLGDIQAANPDVWIGSYPKGGGSAAAGLSLVVRGRDEVRVKSAAQSVWDLAKELGGRPARET